MLLSDENKTKIYISFDFLGPNRDSWLEHVKKEKGAEKRHSKPFGPSELRLIDHMWVLIRTQVKKELIFPSLLNLNMSEITVLLLLGLGY